MGNHDVRKCALAVPHLGRPFLLLFEWSSALPCIVWSSYVSAIARRTSVVRCTLVFVGLRGRPYKGRPDDFARKLWAAVLREQPPGDVSPSQGIQVLGRFGVVVRDVGGGQLVAGTRQGGGGVRAGRPGWPSVGLVAGCLFLVVPSCWEEDLLLLD